MDGALGRGSTRNAGNLAALASLLPRPATTGDMESPKSDKSTGRETLGGGPQRSSSAPGRIGPAGNPGRQRLGGSDSSSKASLLGCLIVRGEGSTAKDDGVQHLPDVGAEEPKDKPMDEKEGGSENEEVFGSDSPKNMEGLFSTPLSPLRKLIRAPWSLIISPWRDSRLPARQILGRGAKRPRDGLWKGAGKGSQSSKGQQALALARRLAAANPVRFPIPH